MSGDLEYRGEGNANIVLCDNKTHTVLRLKKKKTGATSNYKQEHVEKISSFWEHVISPYFSERFIRHGNEVPLNDEFWLQIPTVLDGKRPFQRQNSEIDKAQTSALTLPDLCFVVNPYISSTSPTISVEIKCKKGFLPTLECLSPKTTLKSQVCRFCLLQETKFSRGTWDQVSQYCPLDLFSGEPDRMKHTIQCLMQTPQNNLRIFKDGEQVWGQEKMLNDVMLFESDPSDGRRTADDLIDLLVQCLLTVPGELQQMEQNPNPRQICRNSSFVDRNPSKSHSELPLSSILERLLRLQKLDDSDVEAIYPLYQKIQEELQKNPELFEELNLEGPFDAAAWRPGCPDLGPTDSFEYAVNKVKQFMISTTARDASVMIALQPLTKEEYEEANAMPERTSCQLLVSHGSKHQFYQYTMSLVDLDPKDWKKIPVYFERDIEILKTFTEKRPQFISKINLKAVQED